MPSSSSTKFRKLFDSAVPGGGAVKIDSILRLCRQRLGMESGVICRLEGEVNTIQYIDADSPVAQPGQRLKARETYCHHIHEVGDMVAYHDVKGTPYDGAECHRIYKKNAVIGTPLYIDGGYIGTLIFSSPEARAEPFSEGERTIVALAAACIAQILAQGEMMETLRQREERLKLALEAADIGTWDCNVQTWETAYDERWARMLGYGVDEVDHTAEGWLRMVHPDDLPQVLAQMEMHLDGKTDLYEIEHRVKHKDGHYVWIHDRGRILSRDANGVPLRASGTHIDITARKAAEERSEYMIKQLQQSNAQLDEYAHTIAHDLKQPLTVIEGYLEQLDDLLGKGDEATLRRYIETCRQAALGMEASIAYLLDFASATRAGAPRETVATEEIVKRIAAVMPYMHAETESVIEIVNALPAVTYDRLQLERVFSNLIENAVKYARDGKVHVRVDARRDGGEWVFSVTDDGIGVPAPQRTQIFEIFARGPQAKEKAGHGLGLAICRKIVEDHGGRIGVESGPEGGSRFFFTVPVTAPEGKPK